jgi:polysaccharide pyruvyl transferase WcaK-like protein
MTMVGATRNLQIPIVLRGNYGAANLGDDALAVAACHVVGRRFPLDAIALTCRDSSYIDLLVPGVVPVDRAFAGARAELLVFGGGTQFYSFPLTARGRRVPPSGSGAWLAWQASRIREWCSRRLPGQANHFGHACALGVGVGPFVPGSSKERAARRALRSMEFVAVRDAVSLAQCESWNVRSPLLRTDLCFLPGLWARRDAPAPDAGSKSIGVVVRDWPHDTVGSQYMAPLRSAVRALRADGLNVTYILFSTDDVEWRRTLSGDGEDVLSWDPRTSTIEAFLSRLAAFDALISARYHGVVFATLLAKPVICIEIEQKLRAAATALADNCVLWPQPFRESALLALSRDMLLGSYGRLAAGATRAAQEHGRLAELMAGEFLRYATSIPSLAPRVHTENNPTPAGIP